MNETANKKMYSGVFGFILSLAALLFYGLTSIPAFFLCVFGIIQKKYKKLSIVGLIISILGMFLLTTWTPPGFMPYPLSLVKYSLNAPSFFLFYRPLDIRKAYSQYWLFGGAGGALYYATNTDKSFEIENIINFAADNGWKMTEKSEYSEKRITELTSKNLELSLPDFETYLDNYNLEDAMRKIEKDKKLTNLWMKGFPFWIQQDCVVVFFNTKNNLYQSLIVISKDKSKMAIHFNGSR
ncbi:hypothetical protein [Sedimentisphaera salicampi]|uniref:hypothetical protein n=1 Tax=Sedimentisphaera salicampi TaxID=1941349 RepID=UPI000B9A1F39|nr:hypothetical protein [Sedimentisphaera salicampi]OXU14485.1 hypothetical protein SMSP1_01795 [Sedimentisphaera salicampi]